MPAYADYLDALVVGTQNGPACHRSNRTLQRAHCSRCQEIACAWQLLRSVRPLGEGIRIEQAGIFKCALAREIRERFHGPCTRKEHHSNAEGVPIADVRIERSIVFEPIGHA